MENKERPSVVGRIFKIFKPRSKKSMNSEPDYTIEMSVHDVRILYKSVCVHLDKWPGGCPDEQEHLISMRDCLYRMILEYNFNQ